MDKLSSQTRIIIATVLSFLFFAGYDYFFIPKSQPNVVSTTQEQKDTAKTNIPSTPKNESVVASVVTPSVPVAQSEEVIAVVKADFYEMHIDRLGRVSKFYLNEPKYLNESNERIQLIDVSKKIFPLELRFVDTAINNEAFSLAYSADKNAIEVSKDGKGVLVLTQSLSGLSVIKTITFYPAGNFDVNIKLSQEKEYFVTPGFHSGVAVDSYTFHGALIQDGDGTIKTIDDGDAKENTNFTNAKIVSISDKYYTSALFELKDGVSAVAVPDKDKNPTLFIKGNKDFTLGGYIGPKEYTRLYAIDAQLTKIIEYGFFTFISKPLFTLLAYLHGLVGNWGWAIVIMTIIIRLALYPLTYKGMVSMNKLKELSPKVKELQVKYADDKQKLNVHMMELYKKHGANPMGGCLPILLQIPVFFAIYRVLQNAIELKGAEWILWVQDLAAMDPYFVLPVAMGATMFFHQKITPTTFTDPMQEKIMKFLPLIFTFFFVTFPAGLTLYWFVNNLFSIAQQFYVNKLFAKKHEEVKVVK